MHDVYEGIKITKSFAFESVQRFLFLFLEFEVLRLRVFDIFRFPVSVFSLSSCGSFVFFTLSFGCTVFEFRIIMRYLYSTLSEVNLL